jgi:hypothetical protein
VGVINEVKPIKIWRFEMAPKKYQNMSDHGGDEDWVAVIPRTSPLSYLRIPFLHEGSAFGRCCVSEHQMPNGDTLLIGAHA